LKEQDGNDIWLIGGRELNTTLLNAGLIDEMILTIIPTILGKGIPLFGQQAIERKFKHSDTKTFSTGYVQIKYTK
jgi:dihydrofolate reductase